ncbi:4-hydroxy-tetrahydrodipicolinate synthase [Undibacter mobilis]|uniref:4-hydroxy-tetrahydrodipicolinate synthase n=1 Tax=Undibacter mobilis TaxID=2292256 RepID=A0A371BB54_9BRAD|nr:4-hydroxy-tetrahydrodipicolinate synthase [Undibacter mobilis]RDV04633.1 4-hydroxy-tetrahydrodipicolinate synthase [Undibacter mobilis]
MRIVTKLTGFAPALPTPFTEDDRIDLEAFAHLCQLQLRAGATALVVCGTTGEAPTLTLDERKLLIATAVNIAGGHIPVIAGAGSNATERAIELTRQAHTAGANAVLSVVPYYNKPTQRGMIFHFDAIRRACGIPVIVYDVPSRTGSALTDETVIALAAMPGIIGLKDSAGDAGRAVRLRRHVGDEFRLLSGDDATAMGYIASGGDGCISVSSNVAPGLAREMFLAFRQGRMTRLKQLSLAFARLTDALYRETNPAPVKYAIGTLLGHVSPAVRLPLVEATSETQKAISEAIDYLDKYYPDYLLDASFEQQRDAS